MANGRFEIDPNLGSPMDSVKTYCEFGGPAPKTCVDNSTADSQLMFLHLLHTRVVQSVHLPCSVDGPLRLGSLPLLEHNRTKFLRKLGRNNVCIVFYA